MAADNQKGTDSETVVDGSKVNERVWSWLEERMPVGAIRDAVIKKRVPVHKHSVWYYFGGIALFFFVVQVMTGILLLLYYRPTSEAAFESVQFIMTKVHFGWLIRSIHSWSANLMVAAVFIHLFSVLLLKAYRKPREITWITGVLLLFISLGFGFSGYLLPWNRLAFFATKVGTEIVREVPVIGEWLLIFLRGGEDVTGATLTRFFGIHVAVLPILTAGVLVLHVFLVQYLGMSVPPSIEEQSNQKKSMHFFPNFLLRDLLGWLVALAALAALAALFPWELGVKADLFEPAPAGIQPEWYFLFMFETLKLMPSKVLFMEGESLVILVFGLCGLFIFLVPFLDVWSKRGERSPVFTGLGVVALIYVAGMTGYVYLKVLF